MIVQCERGTRAPRTPRRWSGEVVFYADGERRAPIRVEVDGATVETAGYRAILHARARLPRGTRVDGVEVNLQAGRP
jgi:hypothetical protein